MKQLIFILALAGVQPLWAQFSDIDEFVIGSVGGQITNNTYSLVQSIGDIAGTDISGSSYQLTQGFPQGYLLGPPTGLQELYANPQLAVFPNPTGGTLHLEGELRFIQRYELFAPNGQLVSAAELSAQEIDLSALPVGMYLLRVYGQANGLSCIGKVAKQ